MNAFQALARLRIFLREPVAARWDDCELIELLNEGFLQTAREAKCIVRKVLVEALDKIGTYPLAQILPDYYALKWACWRDAVTTYFDDTERANEGENAFQSERSTDVARFGIQAGNLELFPPPTVTKYTGATVTVVQDSPTVTVTAGNPLTGGVAKGWLFGVGAAPTKWYAIKTVAATSIELQEPYREEGAAGQASVQTSGAMRLCYVAIPRRLRLFANPTATVTPWYSQGNVKCTAASTLVEGTGTSFTLTHGENQEIGLGTNVSVSARPKDWYKVRTRVSASNLRLLRPYPLETVAGADYILTDESPFSPHEERSIAAVYHAAAAAWSSVEEGSEEAARYQGMFEQELRRVKRDVAIEDAARTQAPAVIPLPYHPFFGGRHIRRQ